MREFETYDHAVDAMRYTMQFIGYDLIPDWTISEDTMWKSGRKLYIHPGDYCRLMCHWYGSEKALETLQRLLHYKIDNYDRISQGIPDRYIVQAQKDYRTLTPSMLIKVQNDFHTFGRFPAFT